MKNRTPKKENALGQESAYGSGSETSRKITSRSTETEAQRGRVIEMLRAGPKSTLDFRRAGIMQSQTRIFELRNRLGYEIPTIARITTVDSEGFSHVGVAMYELVAEPNEKEAA